MQLLFQCERKGYCFFCSLTFIKHDNRLREFPRLAFAITINSLLIESFFSPIIIYRITFDLWILQRYSELSKQRLDRAILMFFQNFRKSYVGDQAMHSSKVVRSDILLPHSIWTIKLCLRLLSLSAAVICSFIGAFGA